MAISSPLRWIRWWRSEADPEQIASIGINAHRIDRGPRNFSPRLRRRVYLTWHLTAALPDRVSSLGLIPGGASRIGSDRARRQRCRLSAANLQEYQLQPVCLLAFCVDSGVRQLPVPNR